MRDLRNGPLWSRVIAIREAGVPMDTAAESLHVTIEELRAAGAVWAAVDAKPPMVAGDGTTTCPRCGHEAWPVVYGMWIPSYDGPEPKVIRAGCVIEPGRPDWQCLNDDCEYSWCVWDA
jgi:hypothetical protein